VKHILIIAIAGIALLVGLSACNTEDISKAAIQEYFPDQYDKALSVATCESNLDPLAVSPGGGNWGLFQINTIHADLVSQLGYQWSEMTNAFLNARVARMIYDQSGWSAWSCG
jgi:hypothetical protein